jgi:hypothetical protein
MEGVFFVLIAAALFSHSWHLLGLYHEGRTVGLYTAGLGLVSLIALTLAPMVLSGAAGDPGVLAGTTMMKVLIILWAGYAVGVGAQGLWEFDERAIGFYNAFLTVASAVAFVFFGIELQDRGVGQEVWLAMSGAFLVLTILAATLFFYMAIPFRALRKVAGWFVLVGSLVVAGLGFAILTTSIDLT